MPRPTLSLVVLALVAVQAGRFGAASPRRMLLLHGSGMSAGAFLQSKTASGAKEFLTGVPLRTDAGSVIPPNWLYSALDAGSDDGGWFKDGLAGVDVSIASVEDAIAEQEVAGVIGHEQGATVAALVAARSALGEGPPLKFAVLCGGAMPTAGRYAELLHRLRDSPGASIPTLHCIGNSDGERAQAEELAACFGPLAEILRHDRGGAMPDRNWWEETKGYPERVTGGNRWCTQHRGPWWY